MGLLPVLSFLASCLNESLPPCEEGGVKLHYSYTLHPFSTDEEEVNLFGSDIHKMSIYVFDKNNLFFDKILVDDPWHLQDDNEIYLPLPAGEYTIVSWGGSTTLGSRNDSYEVIDTKTFSDPASFNPVLTKGMTSLEHFSMMLKDDHPEDVTHVKSINTPANLYYGSYVKVESFPDKITNVDVPIVKNTNVINVKLGGISNFSSKSLSDAQVPVDVYITARNGCYLFDNSIGGYSRTVKYEQKHQMLHPDTMLVSFTVLRLMEDDKSSRVVLESPDLPSGQLVLDIVPAIIQADERINNQQDLDRHDTYDILINLSKNLSATIWINSWLYNVIYPGF